MHHDEVRTLKVPQPVHEGLNPLRDRIAACKPGDFNALALEVFEVQRTHNLLYRNYLELIGRDKLRPKCWQEIPCAPIELFRSHVVKTGAWAAETEFSSSGTSGAQTSRHLIPSVETYKQGCIKTFTSLCRPLHPNMLLALLPHYLERGGSGLVSMVQAFVARSAAGSGFFLENHDALRGAVDEAIAIRRPVILWGVAYALLDIVAQAGLVLPQGSMVMETGGMKGRREELTRTQLHERLHKQYKLADGTSAPVWSEYGMTELQSQAYRPPNGNFIPAQQLRVAVRDLSDPFSLLDAGKQGALNLYDLANLDTLSFIQTDDLGRVYSDGRFEVLGRVDFSTMRGCNLMVSDFQDE